MSSNRIDALSRSLADSTSRRSLLTLLGVGVAGTAVTAVGLNEALAKSSKNIGPLTNQFTDIPLRAEEKGRKFKGNLSVQSFELVGNEIFAVAKVTGTVDKKQGNGKQRVSKTTRVKVQLPGVTTAGVGAQAGVQAQATCQILNLVLGPIDLNLLGLKLHVDRIVINLTAESGPGNLLGNLLCSIAGLLNNNPLGQLTQIVNLLNQLLGLLG